MILTCPACATRYFVDDGKLGPSGRKVRCAACSHSWRQEPEAETLELEPAAPILEAATPEAPVRPADALPKSFRAQQEARRRTRKAVAAGAVWAAMAAAFVALVSAAVIFRVQVVRTWPRTAGAYAALRLPVNPLGLQPDAVQAASGLKNGQAVLFVTGLERNVEGSPRAPAALRVSLMDRSGQRLVSQVVAVGGAPLQPGEARPFRTAFANPPLAGSQVAVDFVWTPRPSAVRPAVEAKASPRSSSGGVATLRAPIGAAGPPPRLAEPLPAGSPYALPVAARAQAGSAAPPAG